MSKPKTVRRVVTGHRADGRSSVLIDTPAPNVTPTLVSGAADRAARDIAEVARGHAPRHPAIHRTHSIDYVIVLQGEIDLLLDDGEVRLGAGDVVVQRGTNHAWINRGDAVCRLGMVFIDAEEPAELAARR
jgi:mannose-6-phosphate isomerase-like protein (cupin superfamily)